MKRRNRGWRWVWAVCAAGCVLQAGSCTLNQDTLGELASEVVTRQTANFLSDAVFFIMDNLLVRLSA